MSSKRASVRSPTEHSAVDEFVDHPDNREDKDQHKHDALPRLQRPADPDHTKNSQPKGDKNQQHVFEYRRLNRVAGRVAGCRRDRLESLVVGG